MQQLRIAVVERQHHRCAETAQDGWHRLGGNMGEVERLRGLAEHKGTWNHRWRRLMVQLQRQVATLGADQTDGDRYHERQLVLLSRCGLAALRECQCVAGAGRIVLADCADLRRAGLAVPAFELRQQGGQFGVGVGVSLGLREIVAGHRLAVMAFEIQCQTLGKAGAPDQGLHHAHHLGAFFVDGDGVEVVDLNVAVGPHRVRHRTGVFRKLRGAKHPHVLDAFHGPRGRLGTQVL